MTIERALLSTWDKSELEPLARTLSTAGVELVTTGGTRKTLEAAGLSVTEVGTLTGRPEAFGGRMKTLSFEIASALLFERERDAAEASALGIRPIDLVVCNLYPFEEHAALGLPLPELVEYIDIGGPTMIRAAAKNHRYVTVLTDPADYAEVADEIVRLGDTTPETRVRLAAKAFARTAAYDVAIARRLASLTGEPAHFE
ncbi:MAG: bifunctional phosphoribosylaminoimidazolecarboxamide formyltransferase/IMP cyclohydrolase PurH, partial [Proteobacteria bacterium]